MSCLTALVSICGSNSSCNTGGFFFPFILFHPGLTVYCLELPTTITNGVYDKTGVYEAQYELQGKDRFVTEGICVHIGIGSAWITNGGYLFSLSFLNSDLRLGKRWYICTNTYISKRVLLFSLRLVFLFNFLPVVIYRRFD